jgi:hypothetical protein
MNTDGAETERREREITDESNLFNVHFVQKSQTEVARRKSVDRFTVIESHRNMLRIAANTKTEQRDLNDGNKKLKNQKPKSRRKKDRMQSKEKGFTRCFF